MNTYKHILLSEQLEEHDYEALGWCKPCAELTNDDISRWAEEVALLKYSDEHKQDWLWIAVSSGNLPICRWLIEQAGGETVYRRENTLLGLYVDDGCAAGPRMQVIKFLLELQDAVKLKGASVMNQFLGVQVQRAAWKGCRMQCFEQGAYAKMVLNTFERDNAGPVRKYNTPGLDAKGAEH